MNDNERATLAPLISERRSSQFGTKRAAYNAAGVNAATWDKAEAGEPVRGDLLRKIVRTLWPETDGDWTAIGSPRLDVAWSPVVDPSRLAELIPNALDARTPPDQILRAVAGGASVSFDLVEPALRALAQKVLELEQRLVEGDAHPHDEAPVVPDRRLATAARTVPGGSRTRRTRAQQDEVETGSQVRDDLDDLESP